ncbi:MAG: hypothetical protein DRR42_27075, partial [Gammaproteobacteria bacterium]
MEHGVFDELNFDRRQEICTPPCSVIVLLATFNGEAHIKAQVESIQAQSYQKWNLVIRDDCSTDGTLQIIDEITAEDPRVFV